MRPEFASTDFCRLVKALINILSCSNISKESLRPRNNKPKKSIVNKLIGKLGDVTSGVTTSMKNFTTGIGQILFND